MTKLNHNHINTKLVFPQKYALNYKELTQKNNNLKTLGIYMRELIQDNGFLLLKNVGYGCDLEQAKLLFLRICSSIGVLVPHNLGKKDFVWEVKPTPSSSLSKTFSGHNQDAPLHTDSQYRNNPEKFIALMAFKPARCGGGYTQLVDFKEILQDLKSTDIGNDIIEFFESEILPIAIPSAFQGFSKSKYIMSKIISNKPLVKYRYDTTLAGLSLLFNTHQLLYYQEKLDFLNSFIQTSFRRISFLLSYHDVIIIDNHRFLHGRSSFMDSQRLLLRCRMN